MQASGLDTAAGQGNLWSAPREEKWGRALAATDRLRDRYGFASVRLGSALATDQTERETDTSQPQRLKQ